MKDPLLKYIEENKEELDTYTVNKKNWSAISNKIQKQEARRKTLKYMLAIASILIVFILFNTNLFNQNNEVAQVESSTEFEILNVSDSVSLNRDDINWTENKTIEYEGIKRENISSNSNVNTVFVSDASVGLSSGNYASYSFSIQDNNGCTSLNNFDRGRTNNGCSQPVNNQYGYVNPNIPIYTSITEPNPEPRIFYEVDRYLEQYDEFDENEFETPLDKPLSTFGIDVDGASYSNVRRFINGNYLPPKDAVKLEEMVNYFNYDLPEPTGEHPFSITTEVGECPWEKDNLLMQVALKGKSIDFAESKPNNIVFLIDVSGSMSSADKLPLLKKSLKMMVNEMQTKDKIAIVVYAGSSGLVLPSTSGKNKTVIYEALENLSAGGSTAGGEGIVLAYKTAQEQFIENGNNRIILATDGDFNVGISNDDALVELIEKKRETGIFLSVLGFGTGNLKNSKMEKLADNGNGNYFYIDNILEAKKVLVNEIGGTLITIAKDVKLQLEFNPEHVKSYRLLGYENRILQTKDFDDDTKDSGDLGSGHTIIALYELVPKNSDVGEQKAMNLRYQKKLVNNSKGLKDELAIIKFRYKKPNSNKSKLIERIVNNEKLKRNSSNFHFSSAVVEFGLLIRESKYKGTASFTKILARARQHKGEDKFGYRAEFIQMVEKAQLLMEEYYSLDTYNR